MRNRLRRQLVVVLGVLLLASVCHAGQLFTELDGIRDVVENPGVAILGTLLAIDATQGTVRLLVKQVWVAPGHTPTMQVPHERQESDGHRVTAYTEVDVAPGKTVELPIYRGLVWTDPHDSPIDRRLRDHLDFETLKPKQQVIVLGREVVKVTAEERRKLDLFFGVGGVAAYLSHADVARLRADLEDFDLGVPAAAELERRGRLDVATLLAIHDPGQRAKQLHARWNAHEGAERVAFVAEVRHLAPAPALAAEVLQMIESEITPPMLADVAALALSLSSAQADRRMQATSTVEKLRAEPSAPAASSEVVQLLLEPQLSAEPEALATFAGTLRPQERALLEEQLLQRVSAALAADPRGLQADRAVEQLSAVALARPDPRVAPALARLDFARLPFSARTSIANALVPVVMALSARDPATIPVLKPSMEKLLASDSGSENMTTQKGEDGRTFSIGIVQTVESMMNSDDFDNYKVRFRGGRR